MFAFEISVNGTSTLLAGVEDWCSLSAILTAKRARDQNSVDDFDLYVGGLVLPDIEGHHHVRWVRQHLAMGDEVTIRLVEVPEADAPKNRFRSDKNVQENPFTEEEIYEMQKEEYLRLKKIFEENL